MTHALTGALLARATVRNPEPDGISLRARIALGFFAAAFPDSDIVATQFGPLAYLWNHRGITHSLLLLPLWAAALGLVCSYVMRRDARCWKSCAEIVALGMGSHILTDLITPYGTQILAPFLDTRYAWSTTFIIDLWFSGIIILGLLLSAWWGSTRKPAVVALSLLVAYVGLQFVQRGRALEFAEAHARATGMTDYTVNAIPEPPLPFNWNAFVTDDRNQHYALVSLLRSEAPSSLAPDAGFFTRIAAPYMPLDQAVWITAPRYGDTDADRALAREAWNHPKFAFFRWFATQPALYRIERGAATCVWFEDLKFFTPGRGHMPFRYGMCNEGGEWSAYRLLEPGRARVN